MSQEKSPAKTADKATAVTYFNHAMRSFVTPYGAAAEAPEAWKIYPRLKPFTCEWLTRPHIALSEYADTIVSNLKILENDTSNVVQPQLLKTLKQNFSPIMSNLNALNNKSESSATITDVKQVLRSVVKDNDNIDDLMEHMFHMSNAMFAISSNYLITRSLLRHPQQFSELVETSDLPSRVFKSKGTVQAMKAFLLKNFQGSNAPRKASKDVQDALDSSNDSSLCSSSSSSSSDEDSKERRRQKKKSRKRKHSTSSTKKTRKAEGKKKVLECDSDSTSESPKKEDKKNQHGGGNAQNPSDGKLQKSSKKKGKKNKKDDEEECETPKRKKEKKKVKKIVLELFHEDE